MAEIATLDVNRGGREGKMNPLLLGAGAVAVVGGLFFFLTRRSTPTADSGQILPGSSANIAFSSMQNSLLGFQGEWQAGHSELLNAVRDQRAATQTWMESSTTQLGALSQQATDLAAAQASATSSINANITGSQSALSAQVGAGYQDTARFLERLKSVLDGIAQGQASGFGDTSRSLTRLQDAASSIYQGMGVNAAREQAALDRLNAGISDVNQNTVNIDSRLHSAYLDIARALERLQSGVQAVADNPIRVVEPALPF